MRKSRVSKKEIQKHMPDILRLNDCKDRHVHREHNNVIKFLIKCVRGIVENDNNFKMNDSEKIKARKIMTPFKTEFRALASPGRKTKMIQSMKEQRGSGVIISSLIAAAIPLITSLVSKLFKKK